MRQMTEKRRTQNHKIKNKAQNIRLQEEGKENKREQGNQNIRTKHTHEKAKNYRIRQRGLQIKRRRDEEYKVNLKTSAGGVDVEDLKGKGTQNRTKEIYEQTPRTRNKNKREGEK